MLKETKNLLRIRRNWLKLTLPLLPVLLASCGGGDGSVAVSSANYQLEQEEWARRTEETFQGATAALERTKEAIAVIPQKDNKELVALLSGAQLAIQEIVQKQKEAEGQFAIAKQLMAAADTENQRLTAVANDISQRNTLLEDRERLYSYGFYASIGFIVVSIGAFVVKLPTAFLDRQYRKLEIAQKQFELDELRRKQSERPE